ncbi:MAG: HAD family hydrolase [Pirellulales bacterium]
MTIPDDAGRPAAVAFDLDGLLVNTEEIYPDVGAELLRRRGCRFDDDLLDAMMGRPQTVALATMIRWHGLSDSVETLARETREIFVGLLDTRLAAMPGAVPLLDRLAAAGVACCVATSSAPDYAHDVLARLALADRFAFVLTAHDVTTGKPDPEIYRLAASRFGLPPARLAVLEDSQIGCRAGLAAGAVVVAVPAGHSRRHDFTGVRLVAESLADPQLHGLLGLAPGA